MSNITIAQSKIAPMSEAAIDLVRKFEEFSITCPQAYLETTHVLHGGMYARTLMQSANTIMTSALVKVETILTVNGDVSIYVGDDAPIHVNGHHVLAASAGRKVAIFAHSDTWMTMTFPTDATTVEEVEEQLTDEAHLLYSRRIEQGITT